MSCISLLWMLFYLVVKYMAHNFNCLLFYYVSIDFIQGVNVLQKFAISSMHISLLMKFTTHIFSRQFRVFPSGGTGGSPHQDFVPLHPHKNLQKNNRESKSLLLKIPPLFNLLGKTLQLRRSWQTKEGLTFM